MIGIQKTTLFAVALVVGSAFAGLAPASARVVQHVPVHATANTLQNTSSQLDDTSRMINQTKTSGCEASRMQVPSINNGLVWESVEDCNAD